jgi:hypothetical protein
LVLLLYKVKHILDHSTREDALAYTKSGAIDLRRLPRIVTRPLGRHGADGLAEHRLFSDSKRVEDHPTIYIDVGAKGKKRLEIAIHEALHLACPWMVEQAVIAASRYVARVLWHLGLRFEDERED